jgi:serine/threonine protein phosphatase 1
MPPGVPSLFKRLFGHPASRPLNAAAAPVGEVLYAVGDIHGRQDLLVPLLGKIAFDATRLGPQTHAELIFLGDYVDRGSNSRGVIQLVMSTFAQTDLWTVTALMGNHERTLLRFLDDPSVWPTWEPFGAAQTLLSYGVRPPEPGRRDPADWARARDELNARMPQAHKDFLAGLPMTAERGGYLFVHAGVRPDTPLAQQTENDLLWIREAFLGSEQRLEKVIVHGHTPAAEPFLGNHRIGLDTGAYASNVLTAVKLWGVQRALIQAHGPTDTVLHPPRLVATAH